MNNPIRVSVMAAGLVALLPACGGRGSAPPATPPVPEVGVITLAPRTVTLETELPGRTSAYRIAEVRPQVDGILQRRLFTEGAEVQEGQALYQIDPAPYRAAVARADAAVASAEARLASARLLTDRYAALMKDNVISRQQNDDATASRLTAEADVAAAKAQLAAARIDLDYTQLRAPIAGRIGRAVVTEGALVKKAQDQAIATVAQLDPIYVDVTQSSGELMRLQQEFAAGRLTRDGDSRAKVTLTLEDGSAYPPAGSLQFSEVTVDETTGSVLLRAVFPNPDRRLLPGMFVRARLDQGTNAVALLVPQTGVSRNARGQAIVYVVEDGKAVERVVRTERAIGNEWLIAGGLAAGEVVVVEGLQKVRPGAPVAGVPAGDGR
jgi:membrane fusion protein (multidrug efflux system)